VKVVRTVSEPDLARLKQARHEADGRYNDALTALDAAIPTRPELPARPPSPDETQVTPINQRWEIARAVPPMPGGWRGRLARFVLGLVMPAIEQQQTFNAAVVDHLNRNVVPQRAVPEAVGTTIDALRQHLELVTQFEVRLIAFLQQITPYVDSKDYEFNGLATRITEDVAEAHDQLARTVRGLAAALSGVSDDMLKRWERGERRHDGIVTSLATMQTAVQALKRELAAGPPAPVSTRPHPPSLGRPTASFGEAGPPAPSTSLSSDRLSSHKYVAFEDLFRGDRDLIRERQKEYVALFAGSRDVLDIGCGRGEFLELLAERGVPGRGIDLNHEMVESCRGSGLDVREADGLGHLRTLADGELGGLIAAQVVEHLEPDYLMALLDEAFRVLRPGSAIVLETINVASWCAFFSSYIRDLTHVRPIHPDTLRFVVTAAGFVDAEVRLRAALPETARLAVAPPTVRHADPAANPESRGLIDLANAFDRNVNQLNAQLYGPLDYAVVAWKR